VRVLDLTEQPVDLMSRCLEQASHNVLVCVQTLGGENLGSLILFAYKSVLPSGADVDRYSCFTSFSSTVFSMKDIDHVFRLV